MDHETELWDAGDSYLETVLGLVMGIVYLDLQKAMSFGRYIRITGMETFKHTWVPVLT